MKRYLLLISMILVMHENALGHEVKKSLHHLSKKLEKLSTRVTNVSSAKKSMSTIEIYADVAPLKSGLEKIFKSTVSIEDLSSFMPSIKGKVLNTSSWVKFLEVKNIPNSSSDIPELLEVIKSAYNNFTDLRTLYAYDFEKESFEQSAKLTLALVPPNQQENFERILRLDIDSIKQLKAAFDKTPPIIKIFTPKLKIKSFTKRVSKNFKELRKKQRKGYTANTQFIVSVNKKGNIRHKDQAWSNPVTPKISPISTEAKAGFLSRWSRSFGRWWEGEETQDSSEELKERD